MNTTTLLLGMVGLMMSVGCGDSDDPSQNASPSELQCGSVELFAQTHDSCDGMDATSMAGDDGVQCRCLLGYKWNGTGCDEVSGCSCVGEDCRKLTETQEACEQAHAACSSGKTTFACGSVELHAYVHDVCEAMDARAVPDENGSCFCSLGYAWNGSSCEFLADCACEGADCDRLAQTIEQCEQEHAGCS